MWPLGLLLVFTGIAAVGYRLIESEYDWFDAIYMTVISVTTVGYREIGDLTDAGRMWTMFVIVAGLGVWAAVLTRLAGVIVETRIRQILGRRQLERKITSLRNHTIVCGYGRMGSLIAEELAGDGQDVVIVETDPERTAAAEQAGLVYILGDAQEEEGRRAAGGERAAVLVATLDNDADNLFVTLSARQANPEMRIVTRAEQESSERKLLKAGATSVVCPQTICARRLAGLVLRPGVMELADMARGGLNLEVNQLTVRPGSELLDRTLAELELPRRLGAHVVAIRRSDGESIFHPSPETTIAVDDALIFLGETGSSESILQLQNGG